MDAPWMRARAGLASAGIGSAGEWEELWTALAVSLAERMPHLSEQGMVNVVWAFATAGHGSTVAPRLFAESHRLLHQRIDTLTPQGLANTAWAFATAGHDAGDYFDALRAIILDRGVSSFKSQELYARSRPAAGRRRPPRPPRAALARVARALADSGAILISQV